MRDVLVGVTLPQFTADGDRFLDGARRAEQLGLDSIWVFDHLWPLTGGKTRSILECWTSLAYVASCSDRIGIGTLVTRSSLRHPAVLAKMAATVGEIAPGRLTVAIGSGDEQSRPENESYGITYFAGPDRIEQLESTVRVVTQYLNQDRVDVTTDYVEVSGLVPSPKPSAPPRVWVGGRADDTLEIAGRLADGWNGWGGSPQRYSQDALRVTEFAGAAGGREVELTWSGLVILAADDEQAFAELGSRSSDDRIVGGPDTVARSLSEFVEAGARHLVCTFPKPATSRSYELLAEKVLPLMGLRT
ncbi:MAG: LLM class flavin-dependent oxidoreductase [Actinomycetota bacterium]|nr:LLM class flavin-dependent oxidoreductase [Actinomycetota bacterium]